MLLVFALIIPSMNGITVQAHADDTASVWKIYATVSGEDFTDLELVTASESVEGKELIAKFITDGTYTLTEEDRDRRFETVRNKQSYISRLCYILNRRKIQIILCIRSCYNIRRTRGTLRCIRYPLLCRS